MINNPQGQSLWQVNGFNRTLWLAILSAFPGFIAVGAFLYFGDFDLLEVVTICLGILVPWTFFILAFYFNALRPWQAMENMLLAFREGDFFGSHSI